jgi:hypothetical protein
MRKERKRWVEKRLMKYGTSIVQGRTKDEKDKDV